MLWAILSSFGAAAVAPWVHRRLPAASGWILALHPLTLCVVFLSRPAGEAVAGLPLPGFDLSLRADALSLLLAALISGVGAAVVVYAGAYLEGHPALGRFYLYLLAFMGSMLGLVLADHVLALFVFWELTSLWSYLLIGFHHERQAARDAALRALVVTEAGGLCLLAGLVLLARAGGAWELSTLAGRGELLRAHPDYPYILALVLAGTFTKSAQVPFHFWLPGAMEAPAPASAYLHAATMVKAGIYLLLRMLPVLGESDAWRISLGAAGGATLLLGGWVALRQTDLKRLLAYATVGSLGAMVLLIGVGTPGAVAAALLYLLAHALYKGALFLGAGAVDHATGERDLERLGGLGRSLPLTAAAVLGAAFSMAALPPSLGYLAKESFYGAALSAPVLAAVALAGNALLFAVSLVILRPFRGPPRPTPHAPGVALLAAPVLLAFAGLALSLLPESVGPRVAAAAEAATGRAIAVDLGLWHGWTAAFGLSLATTGLGVAFYAFRGRAGAGRWSAERAFDRLLEGVKSFAARQTRFLQNGSLPAYVAVTLLTLALLPGRALATQVSFPALEAGALPPLEAAAAGLIVAAAVSAVALRTMLAAIAAMGFVGYGIALLFVFYGAPDLAMTQFVVESLTVILYVLVFRHLPSRPRRAGARLGPAAVACAAGATIAAFLLLLPPSGPDPSLRDAVAEASVPLARGRNVVNVILVDVRAIDTLGEITVLATAAAGAYALLRALPGERRAS